MTLAERNLPLHNSAACLSLPSPSPKEACWSLFTENLIFIIILQCSLNSAASIGLAMLGPSQDPENHKAIHVGVLLFQTMVLSAVKILRCLLRCLKLVGKTKNVELFLQTSRHRSEDPTDIWHNIDFLLPGMPKFCTQVLIFCDRLVSFVMHSAVLDPNLIAVLLIQTFFPSLSTTVLPVLCIVF